MVLNKIPAIAALCLLAGCVTTTGGVTDAVPVDNWAGLDVRAMVPPLNLVDAANRAQSRGRVGRGGRGGGGAYVLTPAGQLAAACADTVHIEDGPLLACTVRTFAPTGWTYMVYVSDQYPAWYRELVATREFGHVGQSEFGLPFDDAGFASPTAGLIRRLGG